VNETNVEIALTEDRETTRTAIEQVCARRDMALAPSCYAEDFADYFANSEYHGLDGVRQSTSSIAHCSTISSLKSSTRSPRTTASPTAGC
jgi:hypothetical protein